MNHRDWVAGVELLSARAANKAASIAVEARADGEPDDLHALTDDLKDAVGLLAEMVNHVAHEEREAV